MKKPDTLLYFQKNRIGRGARRSEVTLKAPPGTDEPKF